jgi:hypothetical protein
LPQSGAALEPPETGEQLVIRWFAIVAMVATSTSVASAQSAPPAAAPGSAPATGAVNRPTATPDAPAPVPGSNSFTQEQVRERLESHGYSNVSGLTLDGQGIWRGRAVFNGAPTAVAVDYRGNVFRQ